MEISEVPPSVANRYSSDIFDHLARRLGVNSLYDFQKQALLSVLHNRDSFLLVPTGSGKSFCYVLPSLVGPQPVLVVSPLIALMRDQLTHLRKVGINCASLDSQCSVHERHEIQESLRRQELNVLFVSPEKLAQQTFRMFLRNIKFGLVAVDEAHCVHHWGHGFRPEYGKLGSYLRDIGNSPIMALTATVTSKEREEIVSILGMEDPLFIEKVRPRENLELSVITHRSQSSRCASIIDQVVSLNGQGIIYAHTRRSSEEIFHLLGKSKPDTLLYHGGLDSTTRDRVQKSFTSGACNVLVATKAFGMGLSLPSIRFVFHANMPCSVEEYSQEIGRAGRDGLTSICQLHYGPKDYFIQKFMIENDFPSETLIEVTFSILMAMFERRSSITLKEILENLNMQENTSADEIDKVIKFLYKENVISPVELWDDCAGGNAKYWERTILTKTTQDLLHARQVQISRRLEKLKAMHMLVKGGSDHIREYLVNYFC